MKSPFFILFAMITIWSGILFLWNGCSYQKTGDRQIYVVFRYDDYSALSSTKTELRIIEAFQKIQAPVTFGVIPFISAGNLHKPLQQDTIPLPAEKKRLLTKGVQKDVLDIALHGYSHQTVQSDFMTEFSGVDYEQQYKKLAHGKQYLENIIKEPVDIFVPPWNRYDLNTLLALEELDFSTISASDNELSSENSHLNFLPSTGGIPRYAMR